MNQTGGSCCWCGGTTQSFAGFEEETDAKLLLEILEISSILMKEGVVYCFCDTCHDLLMYATDLKVISQLPNTRIATERSRIQLEQVQNDIKSRAFNAVMGSDSTSAPASLGNLLSKCFRKCVVQLRPEDVVSLENDIEQGSRPNIDSKTAHTGRKLQGKDRSGSSLYGDENVAEVNRSDRNSAETDSETNDYDVDQIKLEVSEEMLLITADIPEKLQESKPRLKCETSDEAERHDNSLLNLDVEIEAEPEVESIENDSTKQAVNIVVSQPQQDLIGKNWEQESLFLMEESFECCGCSEVFKTRKERIIHEKNHMVVRNGKELYKCDECSREVRSTYHLKSHRRSHSKGSCVCESCGTIFENNHLLLQHRWRVHSSEATLQCEFCKRKFWKQYSLDYHQIDCARLFKEDKSVSKTDDVERVPTEATSYKFVSIEVITKDVKQEVTSTLTPTMYYECGACEETFTGLNDKMNHEKTHMTILEDGKKVYKCDVCGKEITTFHKLVRHRRAHSKNSLTCPICAYPVLTKNALRSHMIIHAPKTFQCTLCEKSFSRNEHLSRHLTVHTGEKPYNCNVCDKSFARSDKLVRHRRLHTGDKPYECEYCGKKFTRSDKLVIHRRIHTSEKPYGCEICDDRFVDARKLVEHKKIHDREKVGKINSKRTSRGIKRRCDSSSSDQDTSDNTQFNAKKTSKVRARNTRTFPQDEDEHKSMKVVHGDPSSEDVSDPEDPPFKL